MAFEGHPDPSAEVLRRLCAGEWTAEGEWRWLAWAGDTYQQERYDTIPVERWKGLSDALARGINVAGGGKPLPNFSDDSRFAKGTPREETALWEWREGRFLTAVLLGADREDWFMARDIDVRESPIPAPLPAPPVSVTPNRGGRPATWDWEAAALAMAGRHFVDVWKPATVADVVRALQDWASDNGQDLPDATAKPHAKRIFEAIQRWEKAP